MKRFILTTLLMFCGAVHAATFDILSAIPNTDGWSVDIILDGQGAFAGIGDSVYDFGFGANNDPTDAKFVMTVTSEGFDAEGNADTIIRTVYGTKVVRFPYPNQADHDEFDDIGDFTVRIALSEYVYFDDTAITVSIDAGWLVINSGADSNNNYATAGVELNSSTLVYPMALGKWDNVNGTMAADRVIDDFDLCVLPVAGYGVASVKITATGQDSSYTYSGFVNTPETAAYDNSGNYIFFHKLTVPIAGFDDGELIDCRFQVYPNIGDANSIYDTDNYTDIHSEIVCNTKITILCDKDETIGNIYAVVDIGEGAGTASTDLATAEADPFGTWQLANNAGANIIYFMAGAHQLNFGDVRVSSEWVRAMPHPSTNKANVTLNPARYYRCNRTSYENVNLVPLLASGIGWDGNNESNFLRFRDCTFDMNGVGLLQIGLAYQSEGVYLQNCDGDVGPNTWKVQKFSDTTLGSVAMEGCSFNSTGEIQITAAVTGCTFEGGLAVTTISRTIPPTPDGYIIGYNKFWDYQGIGLGAIFGGSNMDHLVGAAMINNVIEVTLQTADGIQFGISLINNETWNNVMFIQNTIAGERWNGPYNASGSTPGIVTNSFNKGNVCRFRSYKTDTTPSFENAANVGVWSAIYGVGNEYDVFRELTPDVILRAEFPGMNTRYVASQMDFVDDKSFTGTSAGYGDYHLAEGDSAIGILGEILLPFDIDGNERFLDSATNGGSAGAYEFGNAPVPVPDIVGETEAASDTALTDVGLISGTVTTDYSDTVDTGLVISQDPEAAVEVAFGSAVDYVVSLGVEPSGGNSIYGPSLNIYGGTQSIYGGTINIYGGTQSIYGGN